MRMPTEAVQRHLRQLGIICAAMMMGVALFGGVVWYLVNGGGFTPPEGMPGYLPTLFNVVALLAVVTRRAQGGCGAIRRQNSSPMLWHRIRRPSLSGTRKPPVRGRTPLAQRLPNRLSSPGLSPGGLPE